MSELNGQLDAVGVGDSPVPGCGERLDQLAFDCRMSLDYQSSPIVRTSCPPNILDKSTPMNYNNAAKPTDIQII